MTNYNYKRSTRNQGLALVEVLVSVLIITVGIAATVWLNNSLTRKSANFKQNLQAINYAKSKIEDFRSYEDVGSIATTGLGYGDIASSSSAETLAALTGDNTTFTRSWTVIDCPTNASCASGPSYKKVNVFVSWTDDTGKSNTVELVTIISKTDPQDIGNTI